MTALAEFGYGDRTKSSHQIVSAVIDVVGVLDLTGRFSATATTVLPRLFAIVSLGLILNIEKI
ncbi:hypothetical protein H6G96_38405 [Nostoc sp. FACHB-892]|uniref:hypothetical protein n=1 Tax=Nostoc sp. FACHB-892 TaxID=2692843 RepID=UPI0016840D18|nr:hypothetical protein [Nostoc sp. FACHB-892]MBD2731979.1 hypothetical protein [Nostoc sp. FACHB-892]